MRAVLSLTLLLALGVGIAAWFNVVPVAAARSADVPIYLSGIGTVQAYNTVQVKAASTGRSPRSCSPRARTCAWTTPC